MPVRANLNKMLLRIEGDRLGRLKKSLKTSSKTIADVSSCCWDSKHRKRGIWFWHVVRISVPSKEYKYMGKIWWFWAEEKRDIVQAVLALSISHHVQADRVLPIRWHVKSSSDDCSCFESLHKYTLRTSGFRSSVDDRRLHCPKH